ncbi:hypothetical protein ABW19_dt0202079 [Dactylella cylindrospora]|nr:hypothetical protein ABW19_dt0202079 [Dactylella cylindrospora]
MTMQVTVVGRKVNSAKYNRKWDDVQEAIYLQKFKYFIESQVDIYYQDITEEATEFSRVAAEFIRGQLLCERSVDFVFQTNYGLREEEKRDATLYLCHRSSGDLAFQRLIRPRLFAKQSGSLDMLTEEHQYDTQCAMVLYLRFRNWSQVLEISACDIKRDNIDPCTIRLTNQPPHPRRLWLGDDDSDKFPYWPLDDYLRQEDSFQLSRIRFRTREDTEFFIKQKNLLHAKACNLCKTRSKRMLAARLPPDDIQTSLKTCLISSLATASLITFQTEDEETSHLIHPYSHAVKTFIQKQRKALALH